MYDLESILHAYNQKPSVRDRGIDKRNAIVKEEKKGSLTNSD